MKIKFSYNFEVRIKKKKKTIIPFALKRASLAIYHFISISYPTRAHGIIVNYYMEESALLGTYPLVDSIHRVAYFPYVTFVSVVSFNDVTIPAFCFC